MVLAMNKSTVDYLEDVINTVEKAIFSETTTKALCVILVPAIIALNLMYYYCLRYLIEVHQIILDLYLPLSLIVLLLVIANSMIKAAFSCDLKFYILELFDNLLVAGLAFFIVTAIINCVVNFF